MLELQAATFAYHQKNILDNFDFSLMPGDGLLLTGANGSGKTTLLNICSGYLRPQQGTVKLHGRLLESFSAKNRAQNIVMLSAELNTNPIFSVEENIRLGFYVFDLTLHAQNNFFERIIDELNLKALLKTKLSELSLGQQRLVALGRFLAQSYPAKHPQILLCDEPFNHLDERNYANTMQVLATLIQNQEAGFIIATHDSIDSSQLPLTQRLTLCTDNVFCQPFIR